MRRLGTVVPVAGALLLAAAAAGLAHDLRAWGDAVHDGDVRFEHAPRAARWTAGAWLPHDPARRLLALDDELALRAAVRAFVLAERTPRGFDNGERRRLARSTAQVLLGDVASEGTPRQASQADNLLGVLAYWGGPAADGTPADERSRNLFENAVRLDGANADAKFNLELVLRRMAPTGTREGPGTGSGRRGPGRRGAGSGTPGRGY